MSAVALYSKYRLYLYGGFAVLFVALAIVFFVAAGRSDGFNTGPLIGAGVIALLISVIFVRIAHLRVILEPDHLVLVNPLRTHRLRWADVDRIDTFVLAGWKVRVQAGGSTRVAFGLSQYNKYRFGFDAKYDAFDRDAPAWIRRGFAELEQYWQAHKVR
jgi:Bacterial PH domain